MKKKVFIILFIVLLLCGLVLLGYYIDAVKAQKDTKKSSVDSKIEEFGENIETSQTVKALQEQNEILEGSELVSRSRQHLNTIDETGEFTEHTIGVEDVKKEEPVVDIVYPHFFVANIIDRRSLKHYIYDIVVEDDRTYKVTMTTIPEDLQEDLVDYNNGDFKQEVVEDIIGDSEFTLLKSLLQTYEGENLIHSKEDEAMYDCSVSVGNSNTLEETLIWIADRLMGKEVEHLDPNQGVVKSVMGFEDIQTYIVNNEYAKNMQQLLPEENKEEETNAETDDNT